MEVIRELEEHQFTYRYAQPDQYHFCLDSIIFPKYIASCFRNLAIPTGFRTLDVGAGCGVLGLELNALMPAIETIDFIEVQEDFRPYFEANHRMAGADKKFQFIHANYTSLLESKGEEYDLVISNPPYFFEDEGTPSHNNLKNRCRFFLDATFEELIQTVAHVLKPSGVAYILLKSGQRHGRNTVDVTKQLLPDWTSEIVAEIRGTWVLKLSQKG